MVFREDLLTGVSDDAGKFYVHDVLLPTIVTMFTVILSIAACVLLLIIKKQWETYPSYTSSQVMS